MVEPNVYRRVKLRDFLYELEMFLEPKPQPIVTLKGHTYGLSLEEREMIRALWLDGKRYLEIQKFLLRHHGNDKSIPAIRLWCRRMNLLSEIPQNFGLPPNGGQDHVVQIS